MSVGASASTPKFYRFQNNDSLVQLYSNAEPAPIPEAFQAPIALQKAVDHTLSSIVHGEGGRLDQTWLAAHLKRDEIGQRNDRFERLLQQIAYQRSKLAGIDSNPSLISNETRGTRCCAPELRKYSTGEGPERVLSDLDTNSVKTNEEQPTQIGLCQLQQHADISRELHFINQLYVEVKARKTVDENNKRRPGKKLISVDRYPIQGSTGRLPLNSNTCSKQSVKSAAKRLDMENPRSSMDDKAKPESLRCKARAISATKQSKNKSILTEMEMLTRNLTKAAETMKHALSEIEALQRRKRALL
jgi:hypothetical protein